MRNPQRQIRILTLKHRLIVLDGAEKVRSFPIASPMFPESPKYWGSDGRPAFGHYQVIGINREGSEKLERENSIDYPWYSAWKAKDRHKAPGKGLYGVGIIDIDYPNDDDLRRFIRTRESGELQRAWREYCVKHARPLYEQIAKEKGVPFDEVAIDLDFGIRTYQDLLDSFPVADGRWAFKGRPAIHGTNDPDCIGTDISSGCIRMHNKDIVELMDGVEIGTPVEIEASDFRGM